MHRSKGPSLFDHLVGADRAVGPAGHGSIVLAACE
jgi:hypothetical protein